MRDEARKHESLPVTALMSKRSLANDFLKPEEVEAWGYLSD